jgi:long-chain fatty acid transport protein
MFRRRFAVAKSSFSVGFGAALTTLFMSSTAAAGGYFIGPIGGQAVGRGGAFTAKANDLSAAYYNPAGFALIKGTRLQLDNKFSYNTVEYQREPVFDGRSMTTVTFAPVTNTPKFQPLDPLLGVATDFGLSDFAFALVAYANSGISKMQFPEDGGQRYMMTERNGLFVNYSLNAAWRPIPKLAIGVNAQVVAVPELSYQLVVNGGGRLDIIYPVTNTYDVLATVQGKDLFTLNAIIGAWYQASPSIELGLSAQVLPSKIATEGPISVRFTDPNITLPQPTVERDGVPANGVSIELPLPQWVRLGGRYVSRDGSGAEIFDLELDLVYERWSAAERFTVITNDLDVESATTVPLGTINVEKQWQDVFGVNLGADYAVLENLDVRAGGYYETAVSKPEYTNVDFATGQQIGLTAGATLALGGLSVSLGYEYRFQPDVTTTTASGQVRQVVPSQPNAGPVVNGGTYRSNSHSAILGLGYRF